jgi:hypothetical protein
MSECTGLLDTIMSRCAPVVYNYAVWPHLASVSLVHDQKWLPVLDTGSIWLLASVFTTSYISLCRYISYSMHVVQIRICTDNRLHSFLFTHSRCSSLRSLI